MHCEKHPNYKGQRPTKRNCPTCKMIRAQVLQERNKGKTSFFQDFESLTTPGLKVGSFHILAEVSCLMLYGKLPPYFWRKGANCSEKIKKHFQQKISFLFTQKKKRPEIMKELDSTLWLIWAKDLEKKASNKIRDTKVVMIDDEKESKVEIENIPERKSKINIWDVID